MKKCHFSFNFSTIDHADVLCSSYEDCGRCPYFYDAVEKTLDDIKDRLYDLPILVNYDYKGNRKEYICKEEILNIISELKSKNIYDKWR